MLEELERRNYSEGTSRRYLRFVERYARHCGMSPDKLGLPGLADKYALYRRHEQPLVPPQLPHL
jgi:hypothetical protein